MNIDRAQIAAIGQRQIQVQQIDPLPACCFPSQNAEPAERAYCAYLRSTGGLNYQGLPCPVWADLPEKICQAWRAAASELLSGDE